MLEATVSTPLTFNLGDHAPVGALLPAISSPQRTSKSRQRFTEPANELHAAARQYHKLGLPITLCSPGNKQPITTDWPNYKWSLPAIYRAYRDQPTLNVGLVLGPESGLVDFDCDGEAAEETFAKLFDGEVIDTPTWRSRRGFHRLFKWHPALAQLNKSKLKLGGDGAELEVLIGPAVQTLLPPSWSDQFRREWVEGLELLTVEPAAIPNSVLSKLGCCVDDCAVAREEIPAGLDTDSIPTSVVSVVSVVSVSGTTSATAAQIQAILQRCIVQSPGTTNDKFVSLAISLKGLPELADKMGEDLEAAIRYWYERSLANMQEKDWQAVWERWLYLWLWAKPGHNSVFNAYLASLEEPLPQCALAYPVQAMRRLVGLCEQMARHNADEQGVWYLSCRSAAEVLNIQYKSAAKLLKMLVNDGILELVIPGTKTRAARYRYLGGEW
jgi:hypothetical protein